MKRSLDSRVDYIFVFAEFFLQGIWVVALYKYVIKYYTKKN